MENQTVAVGEEIKVVPGPIWWWAGWSILSLLGLVLNMLFLVVVVSNRKQRDLRSLLTAVLVTIAVLDILDIARIVPSIVTNLHQYMEFRIVYCSVGVFHGLGVSLLLMLLGLYLVCPCRDAPPLYYPASTCSGSLPQKLLVPALLLAAGGVAGVVPIIPSLHQEIVNEENMVPHSCVDPTRMLSMIENQTGIESETFWPDLYQTLVSVTSVSLPLLVIPPTILVAMVKAALRGHCCQAKYKQGAGELLVVMVVLIVYLGSVVASVLPILDRKMDQFTVEPFPHVPVLWQLSNATLRPIIYFLCNPAVWEGLKMTCCSSKRSYGSVSTKEDEVALAPVVERVSSL